LNSHREKEEGEGGHGHHANEHDVFEDYGPGVAAYFRLIKSLIFVFLLLSIIIIPVIFLYFHGHGYNHKMSPKEMVFLMSSLGNLGHARATCLHQYISVDDAFHLSCPKGKLSPIMEFGLMPKIEDHPYRMDFCGNEENYEEIKNCTEEILDKERLKKTYDTDCLGTPKCNINLREFILAEGDEKYE
jgi:hypothetical protein